MEPGNLHLQHQFQEQFTGYSSLLSQPADFNKVSSTGDLNPGTGFILNINSNTSNNYLADCIPNSRVLSWPLDSSTPGLSFCHASGFTQPSTANEFLLAKTKDELPHPFFKPGEMMHTGSNVEEPDFLSSKYKHQYSHDLGGNQWPLNSLSSLHHVSDTNSQKHGKSAESIWLSLDLNLQAVDLLSASTYDGAASFSQSSQNTTLDHFMREHKDSPSKSCSKTSTFEDGFGRKKRPSSIFQSKNFLTEAKKNRSTPRSLCPPLKVRKEKLGDRIAALQRLVAPYGKTDTASVLTEAIGYIQFLHDQVQKLSVPNIKPTITTHVCSNEEDGMGQQKKDLRSRGLCLVPVSCVSFFNTCSGDN
ncbi:TRANSCRIPTION FACTOR BHLH110-LIKE [Salix viminalis]|uniref:TRANSCRIPTION FACTOR BHLH110-LIKE n=1 Tax=Salix viminalis TaxID=40686 RepID=A0A9Q0SIH0_SALVM|nr:TRANSCRIPTION FACTOR BHLH110-LIKE [Salix viminalis]